MFRAIALSLILGLTACQAEETGPKVFTSALFDGAFACKGRDFYLRFIEESTSKTLSLDEARKAELRAACRVLSSMERLEVVKVDHSPKDAIFCVRGEQDDECRWIQQFMLKPIPTT